MTIANLTARTLSQIGRHLKGADWPVMPLALVALLYGARVLGAPSYAYWNSWLSCFTALLFAYSLSACLRIVLQSVCFDKALACWLALFVAAGLGWMYSSVFSYHLRGMGVPTASGGLGMLFGLVAASLLIVPFEVKAERARWERRTAEREAQRNREQMMERQLVEARLTALQGQIEPHFLYNTLANARALIRQDAEAAERLLQHLIHFLRSAMPDLRSHSTTLGQELVRAEAYLDIIRLRMGERLAFDIAASDEARTCHIPPLSVMTLMENAIEHGIEPKIAGGRIRITAVCADQRLLIDVSDDGVGFQAEAGNGVGLVNLQERLATLYGDAAELCIEPGHGGGTRASIALPVRHGAVA